MTAAVPIILVKGAGAGSSCYVCRGSCIFCFEVQLRCNPGHRLIWPGLPTVTLSMQTRQDNASAHATRRGCLRPREEQEMVPINAPRFQGLRSPGFQHQFVTVVGATFVAAVGVADGEAGSCSE